MVWLVIGLMVGISVTFAYERNWRESQNWNTVRVVLDKELDNHDEETLRAIRIFLLNPKNPSDEYQFALDRVVRILLRERALELWQYQRLTNPQLQEKRGGY